MILINISPKSSAATESYATVACAMFFFLLQYIQKMTQRKKEILMYGEKIKAKRKAMGLSQDDLAEKLGVTRQAVSKWETDRAQPTMTNLRELAEVFSMDMAYFIGDDNSKKEEPSPLGDTVVSILAYAIGLFFFLVYYFVLADALFHKSATSTALMPLTLYFILATVAFPQAYKHTGDRLDDLDINFFRLVALPALYVIGPVVVLYSLFKKKD